MTNLLQFRVQIHYQTPMHDKYQHKAARTYSGTYIVEATDSEGAVHDALRHFQSAAALSSVSWQRKIVRVQCDGSDVDWVLTP
jgi:hypothetical protein